MIPIFEQGGGRGIGYGLEDFLKRFDEICKQHIETKRAKAFALIFYDFHNDSFRRVIDDLGVFAELDRLAGTRLSIFYLHTAGKRAVDAFNLTLLQSLGLPEATPPCVVFFKLGKDGFSDIALATLSSADLIHAFPELYSVIKRYVANSICKTNKGLKSVRWIVSSLEFLSKESLRDVIHLAIRHIL